MYKTINKLAPKYFQNLFSFRSTDYDLKNAEMKMSLLKPRTDYLKPSFCYTMGHGYAYGIRSLILHVQLIH
jgi:hypothetical protein